MLCNSNFELQVQMKWNSFSAGACDEDDQERVEHNYHDHSTDEDSLDFIPPGLSHHLFPHLSGGRGPDQSFPVKLHYMLEQVEKEGLACVCSWQPHGRCFVVHKPKEFVAHILPSWFRQTKFPSFQRQLNLYGFKRITAGRDKGGYYHELFLRSKRFLCMRIPRLKIKGTGVRKPSSPETEPNFYNMPFLPNTDSRKRSAPKQPMVVTDPSIQVTPVSFAAPRQAALPQPALCNFAKLLSGAAVTSTQPIVNGSLSCTEPNPNLFTCSEQSNGNGTGPLIEPFAAEAQALGPPAVTALPQPTEVQTEVPTAQAIQWFEQPVHDPLQSLDLSQEEVNQSEFDEVIESLLNLPTQSESTMPNISPMNHFPVDPACGIDSTSF